MTAPKLPQSVFIARQFSDSGKQSWLEAKTDVTELAELNESVQVGRYELVEISTLNGVPLLGNTRKVKR